MKNLMVLLVGVYLIIFSNESFAKEYTLTIDFRVEALYRHEDYSKYRITQLYIVPAGVPSWGNDILNGDVIQHGEGLDVGNLKSNSPYFDVKAIIVENSEYPFSEPNTKCSQYIHYNINAEKEKIDFQHDFQDIKCI